jgi:hypothetical protein
LWPQQGYLARKTEGGTEKMLKRNLKKSIITVLNIITIFLTLSTISTNWVFASGGSIAMANYYPDDGGTYGFIDHFLEQTTAVNTNTTVSISIDGGQLIPMTYQGTRNEMVLGDTVARDWYTWQTTIPAITAPGRHTFQFFSHYYVWQDADQYWAEFNSYSEVQSFSIACPLPTASKQPPISPSPELKLNPSSTPLPSPSQPLSPAPSPSSKLTTTLNPQPLEERTLLIYVVAVAVAFAAIGAVTFMLGKRR